MNNITVPCKIERPGSALGVTGLSLALCLLLAACDRDAPQAEGGPAETGFEVSGAWVRSMPPGSSVTAGYLVLTNGADRPRAIIGAHSEAFGGVEIHRTETRGDVSRMRRVERLNLDPGERLAFEPGGHHLMLFQPRGPLHPGDLVPITLIREDGEEVAFSAEVRAANPPGTAE